MFFLMIRRPPRSTQSRSSAASDVYKRQVQEDHVDGPVVGDHQRPLGEHVRADGVDDHPPHGLSLIHISEPTRPY